MMKKLVKVGYRVAPLYLDEPNGTIVKIIDEITVEVKWDVIEVDPSQKSGRTIKENIKFLRKGKVSD